MGNFLQLVLRVRNTEKYYIRLCLTLFSEIISCLVELVVVEVLVVWRKVLVWTFPSVLMRMWLVLVTARATLSGSGLAKSSSNFDKHWRACKYLVNITKISDVRVIKKEKRQDVCSWYCVL